MPSWKVTSGRSSIVHVVKVPFGSTDAASSAAGDVVDVTGEESVVDGASSLELGRRPGAGGR